MKEENHRPTRGVRSNVIKSQKVTEWVPLIGCEMTGKGEGLENVSLEIQIPTLKNLSHKQVLLVTNLQPLDWLHYKHGWKNPS